MPRSCGRMPPKAPDAAEGLKLTADELKKFDIIDEIIPEAEPVDDAPNGDKKEHKARTTRSAKP